jgi:hypothetical protein
VFESPNYRLVSRDQRCSSRPTCEKWHLGSRVRLLGLLADGIRAHDPSFFWPLLGRGRRFGQTSPKKGQFWGVAAHDPLKGERWVRHFDLRCRLTAGSLSMIYPTGGFEQILEIAVFSRQPPFFSRLTDPLVAANALSKTATFFRVFDPFLILKGPIPPQAL